MIKGLIKSIFKAGCLLIIPVLGLILLIIFFGIYLTPVQRNVIFKEMLTSIPIVRQFVSVQHKTQLNIEGNVRENKLKTAFQSFDYLVSIKNKAGGTYIAIYPFAIEAGYELDKIKVEHTGTGEQKKLEITLPAPFIINVDEKSGVMVLRDDLKGDHDLILQPVKIAFEKAARDRAIRNGILDDADKRAKEYYQTLWKGVYDQIDVHFTKPEDPFVEYQLPHLPVKFDVSNEEFSYRFYPSKGYNWFDGFLLNASDEKIDLGYSTEFTESHKALWEKVSSLFDNNGYALKIIDVDDPKNKAAVCGYNTQSARCYVSLGERLFFVRHHGKTEETSKLSFGDVFYLALNAFEGTENDPKYYQYLEHLKAAYQTVNKNYVALLNESRALLDISNGNEESKKLYSIAKALQESEFQPTGDETLDLLLNLFTAVKRGNAGDIDQEMIAKACRLFRREDKELLNTFLLYLLSNEEFNIDEANRASYISNMVQDGYLLPKLVDVITLTELRDILKKKLNERITDIVNIQGKSLGHAVFCGADQKNVIWNCPDSFVYYDKYALDNVFKKGAETVLNRLAGPEFNPKDHLIIVVSRKRFIFDHYDAFVFDKKGIWLCKDILDKRSPKFYDYIHMDMGGLGNEVTLDGQRYQNYILTTFLNEISSIMKLYTKGGSRKMLSELLEQKLVNEAKRISYVPQL